MAEILEIVSETHRRGRPPRYDPAYMTTMRALYPELRTARGLHNKYYQGRAQGVLKDEAGVEWLMDVAQLKQHQPGNYRQTILQELGRIDDDDALKAVARRLCELQPSTHEAVAMIRRWRLGTLPQGMAGDLATQLLSVLNRYLQGHTGVDQAMLLEALARTTRAVRRSLAEADREAH